MAEIQPNTKRKKTAGPLWPFAGRQLCRRDAEIMDLLCDVLRSVEKATEPRGKDWALPYLERIYRGFRRWKSEGCARSMGRRLRKLYRLNGRKRVHPSRTLIDVTSPISDRKRKSRWTRVVEAADAERIPPNKFVEFLKKNGGLSGAARLIAKRMPTHPKRNDWVE